MNSHPGTYGQQFEGTLKSMVCRRKADTEPHI